jgi:hypothetical protein
VLFVLFNVEGVEMSLMIVLANKASDCAKMEKKRKRKT